MAVQFKGDPAPSRQDHALEWLEAIEQEASDSLTDWEIGFIENVGRILRDGGRLSEGPGGQLETLEKIYAEKTP